MPASWIVVLALAAWGLMAALVAARQHRNAGFGFILGFTFGVLGLFVQVVRGHAPRRLCGHCRATAS